MTLYHFLYFLSTLSSVFGCQKINKNFDEKYLKKVLTNRVTFGIIHSVVKQHGSVPERPKGADCKSVVTDFGGPNPPAPTNTKGTTLVVPFVLVKQVGRGYSAQRIALRAMFRILTYSHLFITIYWGD